MVKQWHLLVESSLNICNEINRLSGIHVQEVTSRAATKHFFRYQLICLFFLMNGFVYKNSEK